jgi:hypothetical protein
VTNDYLSMIVQFVGLNIYNPVCQSRPPPSRPSRPGLNHDNVWRGRCIFFIA